MKFVERKSKEWSGSDLSFIIRVCKIMDICKYFVPKNETIRDFSKDEYLLPIGMTTEEFVSALENYVKFFENLNELFTNPNKEFFYIFEDKLCNKIIMPRISLKKYSFDIRIRFVSLTQEYSWTKTAQKTVLPFANEFDLRKLDKQNDVVPNVYKIFSSLGLPIPRFVSDKGNDEFLVRFIVKHDIDEFRSLFSTRFKNTMLEGKDVLTNEFY